VHKLGIFEKIQNNRNPPNQNSMQNLLLYMYRQKEPTQTETGFEGKQINGGNFKDNTTENEQRKNFIFFISSVYSHLSYFSAMLRLLSLPMTGLTIQSLA
jgi:hypothetical protein